MKITRENYEIYFLDYLDGNIKGDLIKDLTVFLRENPDLSDELIRTGAVKLEQDTSSYAEKEKLYKEKYDLQDDFNHAAFALIEGDLSEKDHDEFETYLSSHPERRNELMLFKKTKLKEEKLIQFPGKSRLYKRERGRTILYWISNVAAVLAVAFLVYHFTGDLSVQRFFPESQVSVSDNNHKQKDSGELNENSKTIRNSIPGRDDNSEIAEKPEIISHTSVNPVDSQMDHLKHENVADVRTPIKVPEKISGLNSSLRAETEVTGVLAPVQFTTLEDSSLFYEERLFADRVKEKTGLDKLSLRKITKVGLNLIAHISNEKFNYETNPDGLITEVNFDSRLLAFSIATNQDK